MPMLRFIFRRNGFWGLACFHCGQRSDWDISHARIRLNSCAAVAHCRACGGVQFLKRYYRSGAASERTCVNEFATLERMFLTTDKPPALRMPRPYRYCAEKRAFSMQYLAGDTLDVRMQRCGDATLVEQCIVRSAEWLRALHDLPVAGLSAGRDYPAMFARIEADCGAWSADSALVAQALDSMRAALPLVGASGIRPVPLHGDFKAANLMWTDEGVYGIDASIRNVNPGAMDIAQYLADLLLALRRDGADAITLDRLLDLFLGAYGDTSAAQRRAVMWWMSYSVLAAVAAKGRQFGRGGALDPACASALSALANPVRDPIW